MDTIIGNRSIWQLILAFATDGAFILDVPRDDGVILTHPLMALRKTCKTMHDMIPFPTKATPYEVFIFGANTGNLALCQVAYPKLASFIKKCKHNMDRKVQKKMSHILEKALDEATHNGNINIVKFILSTPFCDKIEPYYGIKNAAVNGYWDICDILLNAYPFYDTVVMHAAGFQNRADIIAKLKVRGSSCREAFVGASCAGHIGLCEALLSSGDITLETALRSFRYDATMNADILALHRKCAKKFRRTVADFYTETMHSSALSNNESVLRMLHAWSIEDGVRPWYGPMLHLMDDNVLDGEHIDARMFQLIREFARE